MRALTIIFFILSIQTFVQSQTLSDTLGQSRIQLSGVIEQGTAVSLAKQDDILYVGVSGHLMIYDVSDPANFVEVASLPALNNFVWKLEIDGTTLGALSSPYAGSETLIHLIDVSDPALPRVIAEYVPENFAFNFVLQGNFLYVAEDTFEVLEIDASGDLSSVAKVPFARYESVSDMEVSGKHVYLTTNASSILVVDIESPHDAYLVGRHESDNLYRSLGIYGDYLYTFVGSSRILVFDVQTPSYPFQVGQVDRFTGDFHGELAFTDRFCYTANGRHGMTQLDLSDPAAPELFLYNIHRDSTTDFFANDILLDEGFAYLAVVDGIQVFDLSDEEKPQLVNHHRTMPAYGNLTGTDQFVATSIGLDLALLDIENRNAPQIVQQVDGTALRGWSVRHFHQNFLYVLGETDLRIYQLTASGTLVLRGSYEFEPYWWTNLSNATVANGHLYVAGSYGKLRVFSVEDPAVPFEIEQTQDFGHTSTIRALRDLLFVGSSGRLTILDISTPGTPTSLAEIPGNSYGFAIANNHLYIPSDSWNGHIRIYDIADVTAPILVDSLPLPWAYKIETDENLMMISHYDAASVYELRDEPKPVYLGSIAPPVRFEDYHIVDNYVYALTQYNGVYIYEVDQSTNLDEDRTLSPITNFQLSPNYPNPFNPETTIAFELAKAGIINLEVFNTLGQRVRVLKSGWQTAGPHQILWDGRDDAGHPVSSGSYFYKLKTEHGEETRRMVLVR